MVKKIGIILIGFLIIPLVVGIIEARNFALGKDCTASPEWIGDPNLATDGRMSTRWESKHQVDPQWIKVDLGELQTFNTVILRWEEAYGESYTIEISDNEFGPWILVNDTIAEGGGTDNIDVGERTARYVKMNGRERPTMWWGYSLLEFEVHNIFPATNIAFGKDVEASSERENSLQASASNVVDGSRSRSSRWESVHHIDPQWIKIDLGSAQNINTVVLRWEGAYALDYEIKVSPDDLEPEDPGWAVVFSTDAANGGNDFIEIDPPQNARYVIMYGNERGTTWGYSLYEFEVYSDNMPAILDVAIRNIADNELTDTITWGGISIPSPGWIVADQYLEIEHAVGYLNWGIQIYTDNQGPEANPEYTGYGSPAGLVGMTATTEVLPMGWHTEDEHVDGGADAPVEENYNLPNHWFWLKDKSSDGFINGNDYITVWNLEGAKWGAGTGERYTPEGTVMVYIAAKFEQATIQTYKTNKFILEQYHQ